MPLKKELLNDPFFKSLLKPYRQYCFVSYQEIYLLESVGNIEKSTRIASKTRRYYEKETSLYRLLKLDP